MVTIFWQIWYRIAYLEGYIFRRIMSPLSFADQTSIILEFTDEHCVWDEGEGGGGGEEGPSPSIVEDQVYQSAYHIYG